MTTSCYINQFRPLAATPLGQAAISLHSLPPFIDASCRREPDLQSRFPSITALCRAEHFAPKLPPGDLIAYLTKDLAYPPGSKSARRLVAVLRVEKSWLAHEQWHGLDLHAQAAQWYRQRNESLPSNCLDDDNAPKPIDQTDRYQLDLVEWDRSYRLRAMNCGVFHVCEAVFCDVDDPPKLTNQQLFECLGQIPNPREVEPLSSEGFVEMLIWLSQQRPVTGDNRNNLLSVLIADPQLRLRCSLITWQQIASTVPNSLRIFLDAKYGIE